VLGGPVGDRALDHPGHDVLALDVVGHVPAVLVEHRDPVVGDGRLLHVLVTVRAVHGVEQEPGGGPVDRHPDLHLVHSPAADPHVVGEHSGCPTFQSSFSSLTPSSTRRLMIPHSNGVKPIFWCFFANDGGDVKPSCCPMNWKYRPCSHSTWCGSTAFSMICT